MNPFLRLVMVAVAFAVLVPAFGVAVLSGGATLIFDNSPTALFKLNDIVALIAWVGFAFGVVPAAGVGLAVGSREQRDGGAGWRFVLLAGLAGGLVFVAALAWLTFDPQSGYLIGWTVELVLAMVGSLLVWRLTHLLPQGRA
jgi:hypothetical protein